MFGTPEFYGAKRGKKCLPQICLNKLVQKTDTSAAAKLEKE